ncbi:MAG: 16S rRNA (cytidine(1402)-2'-O)-methyltransferase [Proteobacteria bacterium]|nr:16S rRNA (cytidine(1402)-2'-O)-methyltransferase [Pseudomonadota bacterium]
MRPRGLVVVATPIGNVADIGGRAVAVLRAADLVACEDTRLTGRLFKRLGIATPLLAYHDHNAERVRPALIARLKAGETVALVADAGTPLVSDPGYKLVRAALAKGVPVGAVPGPSAVLAALVVSGLPTDRFLFAGFLAPRAGARRRELNELKPLRASLVVFESPRRLAALLAEMAAVLGPRQAAVARELTKLFEEVRRGPLAELARHYAAAGPPKGEVVVVVGPPAAPEPEDEGALDARLMAALAGMSVRDAAKAVAEATGRPRREVYARALALAARGGRGRADG